ncbi:MAG: AAA-like domain-containing protein [Candidatus Methanomethylicaceae archaeon]
MTANILRNPFVYGRAVSGEEFVNRDKEIRTICDRLGHSESTLVLGQPHIGRSSLLLQIASKEPLRRFMGDDADRFYIFWKDVLAMPCDYAPAEFWREALEALIRCQDSQILHLIERARQENYSHLSLEQLFKALGEKGMCMVMLLDEFEVLLGHPNFQRDFFGSLRSMASITRGLAMVVSSRLSIAELNEKGRQMLETGSPYFNIMIDLPLLPLEEEGVEKLLDRAGDRFSPEDRRFIRRVAGRHPYLLQAMAACLFESEGVDRYVRSAETFYQRVSHHFHDLWKSMDGPTRTAAVILCLVELGGRALGGRFDYGEIARVDIFERELQNLEALGLAERVATGWQFDWRHALLWQGERWAVGTQAFCWWVRDMIIAQHRQIPAWEEWLSRKQYLWFITQEQWDSWVRIIKRALPWLPLIKSLLDDIGVKVI